jgi:hypothetical protein
MTNAMRARGHRQSSTLAWLGASALSAAMCWAAMAGAGVAVANENPDTLGAKAMSVVKPKPAVRQARPMIRPAAASAKPIPGPGPIPSS